MPMILRWFLDHLKFFLLWIDLRIRAKFQFKFLFRSFESRIFTNLVKNESQIFDLTKIQGFLIVPANVIQIWAKTNYKHWS